MSKTKTFTPILISDNLQESEAVKNKVLGYQDLLTNAVASVTDFIGTSLTDLELEEVILGGYDIALNKARKAFAFTNASDEFNFQALGKDAKATKQALNRIKLDGYIIKDGKIELTSETKKMLEDAGLTYTANEKQNDVYKEMLVMVKKLNSFIESGYLRDQEITQIKNNIPFLKQGFQTKGFEISHRQIMLLDETGTLRKR